MKRMLGMLANFSPLFDAAVAEPSGGAAPAPAAPPPSSGGMWGSSIRGRIDIPETAKPADVAPVIEPAKPAEPTPAASQPQPQAGEKYEVKSDDGKVLGTFNTKEEAEAFVEKNKPTNQPKTPGQFDRPMMGRYKTFEEAEQGLVRSQEEGVRLHRELRGIQEKHQKEIEAREAKLAQIQAELEDVKANGSFKELSKEDLAALKKENPSEYAEYLHEKSRRENLRIQAERDRQENLRFAQEQDRKIVTEMRRLDESMRSNPKEYPRYAEMEGVMNQLVNMTRYDGKNSPFTGHVHTPEILYLAAYGLTAIKADQKSEAAKKEASEAAARKAAADARSAGAPAGGEGRGNTPKPVDENEAYRKSILGAGRTWLPQRKA